MRKILDSRVKEAFNQSDFAGALEYIKVSDLDMLVEPSEIRLVALTLIANDHVVRGLDVLNKAGDRNPKLLAQSRNLAHLLGEPDSVIACCNKFAGMGQDDAKNAQFRWMSLVARGSLDEAEAFAHAEATKPDREYFKKFIWYHQQGDLLKKRCPSLHEAWMQCLFERQEEHVIDDECIGLDIDIIQYWSQGMPPEDVQMVFNRLAYLVQSQNLGRQKLFDKASAREWIETHAQEYLACFDGAFHYAMESDIFRIAYASRLPVIYVDIDCWPLRQFARTISHVVRSGSTLLYLRSYRPWVLNGFFVSFPHNPFIRLLHSQTAALDFSAMPKDNITIERTFGPTRFNNVLEELLGGEAHPISRPMHDVAGLSRLSRAGDDIYFASESACLSVRPPFPLGYKATESNWKTTKVV